MPGFGQLVMASMREWRRDSTALVWSVAFPVIMALVIGILFTGTGTIFFRVGVINEAGVAGEAVVAAFEQNAALRVTTGPRADELDALAHGRREAVIIIPATLADALAAGKNVSPAQFEVRIDPTQSNAQGVMSLIQQTLTTLEARLTGREPLFAVQTSTTTVNRLRSADTMLPGVLAMSLLMIGLYVTAVPLVSLRERAVLRRMQVTPLTQFTLLAAQVVFRMLIALAQASILIALSVVLFDLPLEMASLPAVIALVMLGAAVFITLGYCLAALARTEEAVQGAVGLIFLVFTLLSGVLLPLWRVPGYVRPLVDAIPLTYLADGLRQLMVNASPSFSMTRNVLTLVVWLVACTLFALRFFRWESQA